ncbi:16S rRNA (cytosine1402-N4)-methyltransferase [Marisediminitalea aggregata]|jgi:16S rRNA (cytosine1402-N4)-methyltransferase|uniref:Ribosomal RNA small subunit methyltransferase H n=1 Tax=Marisediminitalea aggregata TaxID=634436 RepID=A0A1M5LLI4_9ALTE|nr:16S rRNA (cytosine(1402)-N(4))-methyltransferase RsmH [Marisediminitalea aggregata]MAX41814.1 16S rRNA (cytosine(1402)-N(4))-methyltransferase [Alteromonadaceae bacterium]MCP9476807.1 16S rRNA (cytosine(1402)-N(4))-methyltransferase RsmH [Marisediminitalea aggregata]SHG65875.1 16S rRNA (cytosine1402-N4)-methyltransferase [Marisediminitalea aggregata]HBY38061.1 16S rRNA (cytosine(1402)-N(4))-methyltransferase [Alteromonas sp.]|tara:strand:- start:35661 stop:36596 length:936 start_codon:yes stop_codon:yes gene_type:complete
MSESFKHTSVLLQECLDGLAIKPDGIYIDATFGRGGHSGEILSQLGEQGRLIAFDRDPQAIEAAKRFADDKRFTIVHSPFADMAEVIESMSLSGEIDGVLMDLGVSSPQLDDAERGFSFLRDGPLDMRMDTSRGQSAAEWLAEADEQDITQVIKEFGEEKFGKRIAHAIVNERKVNPITRTSELVRIIDQAMPVKDKFKHPATRTFQGIRIYINAELEQLRVGLKAATAILKPKGRLAVISFHSLEDRLVKRFMKEQSKGKAVPHGLPLTQQEIDADKVLSLIGKAIKPGEDELAVNVRSRSAVLRVAEKR